MIKTYAPGRAELLGNHTDYNEGYVLAIAVDRGMTIQGTIRNDDTIIIKDSKESWTGKISALAPSKEATWVNYPLGVVAAMIRQGAKIGGFEIQISSTLPIGAGLSSSAAFETATALFLQQAFGLNFNKLELAKIGQWSEHNYVGVKCGLLDQISSLFKPSLGKPLWFRRLSSDRRTGIGPANISGDPYRYSCRGGPRQISETPVLRHGNDELRFRNTTTRCRVGGPFGAF